MIPNTTQSCETRVFVTKVASRCNLACSYCYMYQHADQSWRDQPKFMSRSTVKNLGQRLEEHAKKLRRGNLLVVVHGGEPLLYPDLDYFFTTLTNAVHTCSLQFAVQTNGTVFNDKVFAVLQKHRVSVGVSIDGNREAHDQARVDHRGIGSYDRVMDGIHFAKKRIPHLLDGILQVIDVSVEPIAMLDTLESYQLQRADLLFPDLNHDTIARSNIKPGDIGRWLCAVFDEWVSRPTTVYIRVFMTLISLLLGRSLGTEQLGALSVGALMIETDGSYEIHDGLKTTFHGAGHTGRNVANSAVEVVAALPLAVAFRDKASAACAQCLQCRLFPICGGGSPLHRYSVSRGFDLPSVYCEDLMLLIEHIRTYLSRVAPIKDLAV